MKKNEADKLLKASRVLGIEMNVVREDGTEDGYTIRFFHESKLTYSKYLAARTLLLSLEMETGKIIG